MKRLIAGALALALLTITAGTAFAQVIAHTGPLPFRDHRAASVAAADEWGMVGKTGVDTLYACGAGTGLVDTTIAWVPSDMYWSARAITVATDTVLARIIVKVSHAPSGGVVADLNAATITVQGSQDGYTWGTVVAATAMSNWQADPQKSGSVPFSLGITSTGGWKAYRFILTGISATSGCFSLEVTYPRAN